MIEEKNNNHVKVINGNVVFKKVQPIHDDKVAPSVLNFEIKGKSKICIIGEIGTGKTSILKILAGLKKYKGKVYIDGINLKKFTRKDITDNIIYVQQHPKLFNRTILDNISYGTNFTNEEIIKKINDLKLQKFFKKFENGLNTIVGKEGSKLSGGQKQIIALIRAIIYQKKIILLDEPTSSLDTETKNIFIDLINDIQNKTIIVVSHDKSIYELFDKIIEL